MTGILHQAPALRRRTIVYRPLMHSSGIRVLVAVAAAWLLASFAPRTGMAAESAWHAYQHRDYATAAKLYAQGAKQGDRLSQFNYAMMLFRGEAAESERGEALRWLRRAADAGMMQAQYNMGLLYENGAVVPKSLTEATAWFERAAEQGHTDAQVSAATQYFLGRGAPKDYGRAAHWYREAAKSGDVGAQYILASMYEKGDGVARDLRLALYWYAQAAQQGDAVALVKARALAQQNQAESR